MRSPRGLSRADAEDCAQETALILARKYPSKEEADMVQLAFRIIRWKISEHKRRAAALREGTVIPIDELEVERDRVGRGTDSGRRSPCCSWRCRVCWGGWVGSAARCCCGSWKG